jgi:hypothetical protein
MALDFIPECDFFEHFRDVGKGKTVIFVMHWFGSIVKNANMILWVPYPC